MKRNILFIYLVVTAVLFMIILPLAGCTSTTESTGTAAETTAVGETTQTTNSADSNQVICKNNRFNPESLTVKVGTTVTWINQDGYMHTVTSGTSPSERSGLFDSGDLNGGETFSFTFNEAGTFDYFCIPHFSLGMIGKIIVTK